MPEFNWRSLRSGSTEQRHNDIVVSVIPEFEDELLPSGVHRATWDEVMQRFGTTPHRRWLLAGLAAALAELRRAGCRTAWLDGSFVTAKARPGDYDLVWDHSDVSDANLSRLDSVFFDLAPPRAAQQVKYRGDLLPNVVEGSSAMPFLDFFQVDKDTGRQRGIVRLDLEEPS